MSATWTERCCWEGWLCSTSKEGQAFLNHWEPGRCLHLAYTSPDPAMPSLPHVTCLQHPWTEGTGITPTLPSFTTDFPPEQQAGKHTNAKPLPQSRIRSPLPFPGVAPTGRNTSTEKVVPYRGCREGAAGSHGRFATAGTRQPFPLQKSYQDDLRNQPGAVPRRWAWPQEGRHSVQLQATLKW